MKRCARGPNGACALRRKLLLAPCLLPWAWGAAQAQELAPRHFPATALRGELVVTQPPAVLLNQQPALLAPGARIRGLQNLLLMSGAIVGQRLTVHYTLDTLGQLLDVWILTSAEAARRPWPTTVEQSRTWVFNPDAQTWSVR